MLASKLTTRTPDRYMHPLCKYSWLNSLSLSLLQYIDQIRQTVVENLRLLPHSPSVQMQQVPPDMLSMDLSMELSSDTRIPAGEGERDVEHPAEFYSSGTDHDHLSGVET
ncbi:Histone deacetylase 3 [Geodia barretti]|uniref:Histone deacetylase 3 n=1 Tax=Geodia barretti TaxID=519541 RepID=A0AA35XME3_GEOBA|nr:Histone deacetylase 3 [Geodia barretti]